MKRIFEFSVALLAILAFLPLFLIISLLISFDSKGGIFYKQNRVGRNKIDFKVYKFRTMHYRPFENYLLTIGAPDLRITKLGYWLRKYKIDELPQLVNILKGEMSFVGPRPEIRRYVNYYNVDQQRVFSVKPGITDWAYIMSGATAPVNESKDPERYIRDVMPSKISHNLRYLDNNDLWLDLKIIFLTLAKVARN